jgi:hypothetical protein
MGGLALTSGIVLITGRGWLLIVPGAVSIAAGWGLPNATLGRNVAVFTLIVKRRPL